VLKEEVNMIHTQGDGSDTGRVRIGDESKIDANKVPEGESSASRKVGNEKRAGLSRR
jgi:hypothetical protein